MFLDHRGPESIQLSSKPLCREDENQICSRNDISDNACLLFLQSVSDSVFILMPLAQS